jgi:hypothetical protein
VEWDYSLNLEANILKNIPLFTRFLFACKWESVDGFVLEVRGKKYGENLNALGKTVKTVS